MFSRESRKKPLFATVTWEPNIYLIIVFVGGVRLTNHDLRSSDSFFWTYARREHKKNTWPWKKNIWHQTHQTPICIFQLMMSLSRNHNFSKIYGKWMNMDTCCCKQYRKNTFCHCQKCRSEWHALGRNKSWSHWLHLWHRLKLAPECWSWRRCGSVSMVAMWWLCGGWRERRTVKSLWVNCLFCVGGWDIKAFQSWLTSHGVQNQKKQMFGHKGHLHSLKSLWKSYLFKRLLLQNASRNSFFVETFWNDTAIAQASTRGLVKHEAGIFALVAWGVCSFGPTAGPEQRNDKTIQGPFAS